MELTPNDEASPRALLKPSTAATLAVIAAALVLATLEASQLYLRGLLERWYFDWRNVVLRALASWMTLAALSPLVVRAARRGVPWPPRWRTVTAHLIAASCFTLGHIAVTALLLSLAGTHKFVTVFRFLIVAYTALDLLLYVVIVITVRMSESARTLRQQEHALTQLRVSLQDAQLASLRGQLNPHFLFNTLNSISGLAVRHNAMVVADALAELSILLRDALATSAHDVSLDHELSMLTHYVSIQQLRFGENLAVTQDIDPTTRSLAVPRMILQPIVENAIQHGMEPGVPLQITITARREPGGLRIIIRDNGRGVADTGDGSSGVGLANTRARLASHHGDAARLSLTAALPRGTSVALTLPATTIVTSVPPHS